MDWDERFVESMVYYGVSLNVSTFSGDAFANNAISGAVEIPAYLSCVPLLVWGRKRSLSLTLFSVAGALLCVPFIKEPRLNFALVMLGKFFVTASFSLVFVATAEWYPTVIRGSGLAVSSTVARIGSMIAPYLALISNLSEELKFLPLVLFGALSLLAGLVVLVLPETKGLPMPETLQDTLRSSSDSCSGSDDTLQETGGGCRKNLISEVDEDGDNDISPV